MSRISPASLEQLAANTAAQIDAAVRLMGFAPQDALVMARNPALLDAVAMLVTAVYGRGKLDGGLKRLIGEATSKAAGCFYCSAHAANGARDLGVPNEKISAVWTFEDSPVFTEAERAAIRVAIKSGRSPNETDEEDFADLRRHYDDDAIIEIISVIAMFGFLNRWNSTLKTSLEPRPAGAIAAMALK